MNTIDESIMYLFKAYLIDEKDKEFSPNIDALKKGILIDKNISEDIVQLAINLWGIDGFILNQTFHKSINKVISASDEELLMTQILHYITTYSFEELGIYNKDLVYIPNEKLEVPELESDIKLINIVPVTKKELREKLWDLITSGIALSAKTIECILNLSSYLNATEEDLSKITNREVKVALYSELNIIPKNNIEFLRYLIYKLTDNTLLIKDKDTYLDLKTCDKKAALEIIKDHEKLYGLIPLSEIFNRFKPLFLALRTNRYVEPYAEDATYLTKINKTDEEIELNKTINKIAKLSKKHHKPFIQNDLDNFLIWYKNNHNEVNYLEILKEKLNNETIWRIIKLRNYIYLVNSNISERVYKIRNGKTWITDNYQDVNFDKDTIDVLDNLIADKLKPNVSGKKIYLDNNIDIVLPQSEKQFIGNLPFSSSINIDKNDILVGIHWYNVDDNRVDLDLKVISNEYTIGWDFDYKKDNKIIFTGDVTDAPYPNGASEYIYISKLINNTTFSLKVNNYTRNVSGVEYDIIIANKPKDEITKNYVVNPNDIIIKIPKNTIERNKTEHSLGNIIIDDDSIKLVLTDLTTSNRMSSSDSDIEEILRNYLEQENIYKCKLKDYLEKAGAIIIDNKNNADIDLGVDNLNKNSIIDLLK